MSNSRLLHITLPLIAISTSMVEIYDQDGVVCWGCRLPNTQAHIKQWQNLTGSLGGAKSSTSSVRYGYSYYLEKQESTKSFENQASALFYTFSYIINKFQLHGISVPDNQVCQTI